MPLVIVTRNPELLSDREAVEIGPLLQQIVAAALTCEEGKLTQDDIEVRFREAGPLDVGVKKLQIEVIANDYLSRRINLQQRTEQIGHQLQVHGNLSRWLFGGKDTGNFVWVRLTPAGFAFL